MKVYRTEIEIEAPSQLVWEVLIDLESYPDWNPFLQRASGDLVEGERLEVFIKPPRARGMTIRPRVIAVEEGAGFSWKGSILFPGLFDGEHYFVIDPLEEGCCRFVQGEEFTGMFVFPILWLIGGATRRGFERMNEALKARAEAMASTDDPSPSPGE